MKLLYFQCPAFPLKMGILNKRNHSAYVVVANACFEKSEGFYNVYPAFMLTRDNFQSPNTATKQEFSQAILRS